MRLHFLKSLQPRRHPDYLGRKTIDPDLYPTCAFWSVKMGKRRGYYRVRIFRTTYLVLTAV